jgi:hypothetical protein
MMTTANIIALLQQEIERQVAECKALGGDPSEHLIGLLTGIRHAIDLIKAAEKVGVVSVPHLGPVA